MTKTPATLFSSECYELRKHVNEQLAEVYIGWNASISACHADTATTQLLKHLVNEKQTIEQAVKKTMQEVKPDPASRSVLEYYPLEARDRTIESKG
jgi:hypothetical protein